MTDVILTVDNRTPKPLRVYLESGARSDSLGSVPRQSIRSFSVPSGVGDSTELHLRALAPGSPTGIRSQAFHLVRGDQVVWTLDRATTTVTTR